MEIYDWFRANMRKPMLELVRTFDDMDSTDEAYAMFYLLRSEFDLFSAGIASQVNAERREEGGGRKMRPGDKKKPKSPRPTNHPQKLLGPNYPKGDTIMERSQYQLISEMLAVLKEMEFVEDDSRMEDYCAVCLWGQQKKEHAPDCKLAATIAKAEAAL
jgi:hypothetical protein